MLEILVLHSGDLAQGLFVTVKMCAIAWCSGLILGLGIGVLAAKFRTISILSRSASAILAGVPALVMLFWFHYPVQAMFNVTIDPFITASFTLSIYCVVMVADSVRSSLSDLPYQYALAGKVCGLSNRDILIHIKLPILYRQLLPTLLVVVILVLQMSLFASLISVDEVFRVAQRINSLVYRPVEIYTALAFLFVLLCVPLHLLAIYLRQKYTRDLSER